MTGSVSCLVAIFVLCSVCVIGTNSQGAGIPATCPMGWYPVHGTRKCLFFSNEKDSWINAAAWCSILGGTFVEVNDHATDNAIRMKINSSINKGKHWLGATDIELEGRFKWMNSGRPMTFRPMFFQVSHAIMKNCLNVDEKGAWRDESCTAQFWFICEKILK